MTTIITLGIVLDLVLNSQHTAAWTGVKFIIVRPRYCGLGLLLHTRVLKSALSALMCSRK